MTRKQPCDMVYIASCRSDGGIFRYLCAPDGTLAYLDKIPVDKPMYLAATENTLYALLRAPFPGSSDSGLISYQMQKDRSFSGRGAVVSTNGVVACHLTISQLKYEIYCANYISGSITKIGDRTITHTTSSDLRDRQQIGRKLN